jgi:hypothetical protein
MSENTINQIDDVPVKQEKVVEQNSTCNRIKFNKVCVIITQKKNSSWVDDLDARERLNKCQVVFH